MRGEPVRVELPFEPAQPRRVWPGTKLYHELCSDPEWIAEPKVNGWRCIILGQRGGPLLVSRQGLTLKGQGAATAAKHVDVPPETWLDAELLAGVLHVFDVVRWAGQFVGQLPLSERRAKLVTLIPQLGPVRTMPRVDADSYIRGGRDEGVVFKHQAKPYPGGLTNSWIKCRR
jgi:ATP-dependent DNA ligase